jgi:hypothetical protein
MTGKRQKAKTQITPTDEVSFALGKENYILLIIRPRSF